MYSTNVRFMLFKTKKRRLNALNLIYCRFNFTQRIIIEDIGNIIKGALECFSSIYNRQHLCPTHEQPYQCCVK